MTVLVTGGTGFIGSYLLAELINAGRKVVAVRRHGAMPPALLKHQPKWLDHSFVNLTADDMNGIDTVIHLASAGVSPKQASWQELYQINIEAGCHLIQQAHKAGVRRIVVAGSCLEYGAEAETWERIPPSAPLRPTIPYGASKAAGFLMMYAIASSLPIELVYARIFTAYGEGQFSSNLWPSLRQAAASGVDFPMTLGEQILDFIPVIEVARHLRVAAERSDVELANPLVINIGSGMGLRVVDFARQQWELLGATGRLLPGAIPGRHGQVSRLVADTVGLNPS